MIGLHLSRKKKYGDQHKNIYFLIEGYKVCLSYHEHYNKEVYFENNDAIVLIDGWIFNSPDYSEQARFVHSLFASYGKDAIYYLDGQFNILIYDKIKHGFYIFNDIFSFRKHFYIFNTN